MLLDDYGSTLEAGQAQVEQGLTLIEAGDSDEALPLLEAAMPLVEGVQPWTVTGRLGLAVAIQECGDPKGAGRRRAPEVVSSVGRYLVRSRYRPELPFEPTHGKPLVRELPPRQRRLLRLSFGLGLDLPELGRLLGGAKPESVRRARWRAIIRLRELMAAER